MYKSFLKRALDIIFSCLAMLLVSPIFLLISITVIITSGSPIFFKQYRPGLNEKIFKLYKFRTMTNKCDKNGNFLSDEHRITKFGNFLRSTSLDELPGLWNVFNGNMSFVGPRPLLVEYLPLYSKEQAKRHEVKPGITGWAQVNGRNAISWEQKFKMDIWYIKNQSFFLDIKILLMTIKKVLTRDGISHNNHATMDKFRGNL